MTDPTHTIIRIPRDAHYQIKIIAAKKGCSILEIVEEACREYIKRNKKQ